MRVAKDLHVHERHSGDTSNASVEGYCRVAEERGIDEVCFTTHLIVAGHDRERSILPGDIPEYIDEVEAAQATTSVELRIGLEVDYFPGEEGRLASILDEHHLDLVLGSLHYVKGHDIGARRGSAAFFGGRGIAEALSIYYGAWRMAVESGLFDIMAHPDYFRKHLGLTRPDPLPFDEYGPSVHEAIDSLRRHGVGVEVNASGYRHGIEDCYPTLAFLRAAKAAGVEVVTLGSDCHTVAGLGSRLEEAVRRLEEAGYSSVYTFEGRRCRRLGLDEVRRESTAS